MVRGWLTKLTAIAVAALDGLARFGDRYMNWDRP